KSRYTFGLLKPEKEPNVVGSAPPTGWKRTVGTVRSSSDSSKRWMRRWRRCGCERPLTFCRRANTLLNQFFMATSFPARQGSGRKEITAHRCAVVFDRLQKVHSHRRRDGAKKIRALASGPCGGAMGISPVGGRRKTHDQQAAGRHDVKRMAP